MTRHEERELIISLLYEYTFYEGTTPSDFISANSEVNEIPLNDYVKDTFLSIADKLEEIDKPIAEFSVGWKVSRMSKVTRSILRLAVYEIIFTDTPPKAVINEAVELSKTFAEDKAPAFINGILNKIARAEGKIADAKDEPNE